MSRQTPTSRTRSRGRKRRSPVLGCLGIAASVILVPAIVVATLYALRNRIPSLDFVDPPMPAVNAYADFVRAGKMCKSLKHPSPISVGIWPNLAICAACAKEAEPILILLHRAVSEPYRHPAVRSYARDNAVENGYFRELARTAWGAARYYELCGRPARAVDIRLDCVEMGVRLPYGAGLMDDLVGRACESIGQQNIEALLPKLSTVDLARVAGKLARINAERVPYADIVTEEGRIEAASFVADLRKRRSLKERYNTLREELAVQQQIATWKRGNFNLSIPSANKTPTWAEGNQILRYLMADKAVVLQENLVYFAAVADEARKPYAGPSTVKLPNNLHAQDFDIIATERPAHLAHETVTDLLEVEVALLRYRARYGRFPANQSDLMPAYLAGLPQDPFGGGRPFLYRPQRDGKGYALYSRGRDLRDDGGVPVGFEEDVPAGDIVAGHLFARRRPGGPR